MAKTKSAGNGEGTLYYDKNLGLWKYQYYINGSRKAIKQRKKETSRDFKARVTKLKNELNNGTYIGKSTESVISLLEQYINSKHSDGTTSDRSYTRELSSLSQIKNTCSNFCNKPIQEVTIKDIEKAKEKIKVYSNSTISKIWELLNKAFYIASSPSRNILNSNIMLDIELKKPLSNKVTKKVTALTEQEKNKLLEILDNEERNHKYRNIVKMQLVSGMRIGEVLARSINDFNSDTKKFNIHNTLTTDVNENIVLGKHTKTFNKRTQIDGGQRFLPLNTPLFADLLEIIEEQKNRKITNIKNLLFWDYDKNTFISPREINSWLLRLNTKYNICKGNLSSHKLRHTALTNWRNIGVPLPAIQYLAGHAEGSKITNEVYIDTSLEYVEEQLQKII